MLLTLQELVRCQGYRKGSQEQHKGDNATPNMETTRFTLRCLVHLLHFVAF